MNPAPEPSSFYIIIISADVGGQSRLRTTTPDCVQ